MRIAFTILYNGMHHLQHRGFSQFMARAFDYWIVIEGLAGSGGSTSWCKNLKLPPRSTDGSHEFMVELSRANPNVIYHSPGKAWQGKDNMVNEAVKIVSHLTDSCYLWQVDVDEVWDAASLDAAEAELTSKAGAFQFNHYLCRTDDGRQLVAHGEWGDGFNTRLFQWSGEKFLSHEPPVLQGQGKVQQLSPRYEHFSYYFEQDVRFKAMYYKGHQHIYENWKRLKTYTGMLPASIKILFGGTEKFNSNKSYIDVLHDKTELLRQADQRHPQTA